MCRGGQEGYWWRDTVPCKNQNACQEVSVRKILPAQLSLCKKFLSLNTCKINQSFKLSHRGAFTDSETWRFCGCFCVARVRNDSLLWAAQDAPDDTGNWVCGMWSLDSRTLNPLEPVVNCVYNRHSCGVRWIQGLKVAQVWAFLAAQVVYGVA